MSKWRERARALELLRRHPGWSDRRIAARLGVSNSTVTRWRRDAGFPLYRKRVRSLRRRVETDAPADFVGRELARLRQRNP